MRNNNFIVVANFPDVRFIVEMLSKHFTMQTCIVRCVENVSYLIETKEIFRKKTEILYNLSIFYFKPFSQKPKLKQINSFFFSSNSIPM